RRGAPRALLREPGEALLHLEVRNVRRTLVEALQLLEIVAPPRLDRGGILQKLLVERLDERRVGSEEIGTAEHLLHHRVTLGTPGRPDRRLPESRIPVPS